MQPCWCCLGVLMLLVWTALVAAACKLHHRRPGPRDQAEWDGLRSRGECTLWDWCQYTNNDCFCHLHWLQVTSGSASLASLAPECEDLPDKPFEVRIAVCDEGEVCEPGWLGRRGREELWYICLYCGFLLCCRSRRLEKKCLCKQATFYLVVISVFFPPSLPPPLMLPLAQLVLEALPNPLFTTGHWQRQLRRRTMNRLLIQRRLSPRRRYCSHCTPTRKGQSCTITSSPNLCCRSPKWMQLLMTLSSGQRTWYARHI